MEFDVDSTAFEFRESFSDEFGSRVLGGGSCMDGDVVMMTSFGVTFGGGDHFFNDEN